MTQDNKTTFIIGGVFAAMVILAAGLALMAGGDEDGAASIAVAQNLAFSQCLADAGVVTYGSRTCPACQDMIRAFGGYTAAAPVYVECMTNQARCGAEMQTQYVPEVQINSVLFTDYSAPDQIPQALAQATGCEL
jgi:hypothetical protein